MADTDKRMTYYNGQILQKEDFDQEQLYHLDRLRRHHRLFHTPGIADGLAVTAREGDFSVRVDHGTAVDKEGRPIVLLDSRTVRFGTLVDQWILIVISYQEKPADPASVGRHENTRCLEEPDIVAIPESDLSANDPRIPLARLRIDGNGAIAEEQDTSVRTWAGTKVGTELPIERIQLSRQGVTTDQWPVLSSGAPGRADLTGALSVSGDLSVASNLHVTGAVNGRTIAADGARLDAHAASTDNPHRTTAEQVGALTGVGGISNPGGNIGLVGQAGISITGDDVAKKITIANSAGSLKVQNPLGSSLQVVQDQNGQRSPLAIATGKVGIGTNEQECVLTIAGNITSGAMMELRSQGEGASIEYVNKNGGDWIAGVGPANSFFFLNRPSNSVAKFTPDGTLIANGLKLSHEGVAADLTGDLSVTGKILLSGTVDGRDVSADGARLDQLASSTLEGVSNPGGNIDLVGQKGITVTGDNTAKTITIANAAGSLTAQSPLGPSPQFVQDQNGNKSPLAIGTGTNVGIGTTTPACLLTVAGNVSKAPTAELYSLGDESSIRYVNSSGTAWHVGSGGYSGAKNFFFWSQSDGMVATMAPEGTLTLKGGLTVNGGLSMRRAIVTEGFGASDVNGAIKTVEVGFQPKFITMEGRSHAWLGKAPTNLSYGGAVGGLCHVSDSGSIVRVTGHGPHVARFVDIPHLIFYNEVYWGATNIISGLGFVDHAAETKLHVYIEIIIDSITSTGFKLRLFRKTDTGFSPPPVFGVDMMFAVMG